ncbi:probable calcium-binding protein cml44 [Phtheirospermum japonicum]|uniref:Probable calcium-binding protein cml44 n=1 Tax=Phtheirospermum japonicum TaxID=374723 RepID=A0A830CPB3_9LAMI|nr:probable calcium-binding protein cml44 [Phtheirospermum japonicum]
MSRISSDDLHRIFKNLDKDNNGQVDIQELHHLLDTIGIRTTLDELEKYVGRKSLNYFDFLFFYEAMEQNTEATTSHSPDDDHHNDENDLFKAFKVFDLNGDGYISSEELQSVLSRLGLLDKTNGHDCKDMISVYDENSDGVLDFGEFKNMMSVTASTSDSEI